MASNELNTVKVMVGEPGDVPPSVLFRGFEPARSYAVWGDNVRAELFALAGVPPNLIFRSHNFSVDTPNDDVVLSLVSIVSYRATKFDDPYCEIVFRTWVDRPSAAFELKKVLEEQKNGLSILQFSSAATDEDTLKNAKRVRVLYDWVEVLPFGLDMTTSKQAMERVVLHNARYELEQAVLSEQ